MDEFELPHNSILYADCSRGRYIPQFFAETIRRDCLSGTSEDDLEILRIGPDHEFYWESWDSMLDNAIVTDDNGVRYDLHHDGDLWLVPVA